MHAPGKSKTKSYKFALKLIIMNCGERSLLVPRERAVRTYIMADEHHEPGGNAITSTLFGQTSSQAVAVVVQTVQIHSDGLGEAHVGNAVGLLSAISSKAGVCTECFPESCSCVQNGLSDLMSRLAALEGTPLSISQRGQREALEKLLSRAIGSAAGDQSLARATIGALGRVSSEGCETLVPRLLCEGVPNAVGLLRASAPVLIAIERRLGECEEHEGRMRALSSLVHLWQQAAVRWPCLSHARQLAQALAKAAMPSVTNDPSCKLRLAATRLLLLLAPHMRDSDALRQAALLKSQDKAKEVRRVGLLLLAALVFPTAREADEEAGEDEDAEGMPEERTWLPRMAAEQVTQLLRDALEPGKDAKLLRRLASAVLWRFVVSEHVSDPAAALRALHALEQPSLVESLVSERVDALFLAQFGEVEVMA